MEKYGVKPCPFNKAHVVPIISFQRHIVKCGKNYKGRKVPCPYSASEYLYPEEMNDHIKVCSYKPGFIPLPEQHGAIVPAEFEHNIDLSSDDDWSD